MAACLQEGLHSETGLSCFSRAYQTVFGGGNNNEDRIGAGYDMAILNFLPTAASDYMQLPGGNNNEQPHSMIVMLRAISLLQAEVLPNNYKTGAAPRNAGRTDYDIIITKLNAAGNALLGSVQIGGGHRMV